MKRLFGTDGIRGEAGTAPLDPPTVRRFGLALGEILGAGSRVALGRDTRESGPWLRDAVSIGLARSGAQAVDMGVIPTPGLAHVVRNHDFAAAVMISASHNPFADNGLKVFAADGFKLSDVREKGLEERILDHHRDDPSGSPAFETDPSLALGYVQALAGLLGRPDRLSGMHLVLDCANGAASPIAPDLFRGYGAKVDCIGVEPDGVNINLGCGSLHLDCLAARVRELGADLGLAFDGDADRCLAVDRQGRVVDGDYILYITASAFKRAGKLRGSGIVATIMSNYWLEERLTAEGIRMLRAPVGDKYVQERMTAEGLDLGGEQSGHVIFRDHATTGDGILTGLQLLGSLLDQGRRLEEMVDEIRPYPQVLVSVRVRDKPDLRAHPAIGPLVAEIESSLEGSGRVVLRYSGTEPVARIMLEGKDAEGIREQAGRLVGAIRETIGA